jgi:glycosyltransferase involved in cell wall biosynthesis
MESVISLRDEAEFEFVVVDNNSTDVTPDVVRAFGGLAKYVFEGKTSFTAARRAGGINATGDILLYLDDDVIVRPGSLTHIVEIFSRYPNCGIIAGHIDAKFTEEPPTWALACQKSFNGWSLFNRDTYDFLHADFQEVSSAAGPAMAIRKSAYDRVGGFPPDTVGVETNRGAKTFNKLYIGPGDYGICEKIRGTGLKVYYSKSVAVFHVIPPARFTIAFWRSRMIGEGYHIATTQRGFYQLTPENADRARLWAQLYFLQYENRLLERLATGNYPTNGVSPDELWLLYYKAYLDMDHVLRLYPLFWKTLWEIGDTGVDDENYDRVTSNMPPEYKALVANDLVCEPSPLTSVMDYERIIANRGFARQDMAAAVRTRAGRKVATLILKALLFRRSLAPRLKKVFQGRRPYLNNGADFQSSA